MDNSNCICYTYVEKKNVFFSFIPPTNENKKKIQKKSLFMQNFILFSNCIYYTLKKKVLFKMPLILLKNVKKQVIYEFFQKKSILSQYSVFFCLFFDENNEIRRKSSKIYLFGEKMFFFVKWHILLFSELKKMVFLR